MKSDTSQQVIRFRGYESSTWKRAQREISFVIVYRATVLGSPQTISQTQQATLWERDSESTTPQILDGSTTSESPWSRSSKGCFHEYFSTRWYSTTTITLSFFLNHLSVLQLNLFIFFYKKPRALYDGEGTDKLQLCSMTFTKTFTLLVSREQSIRNHSSPAIFQCVVP